MHIDIFNAVSEERVRAKTLPGSRGKRFNEAIATWLRIMANFNGRGMSAVHKFDAICARLLRRQARTPLGAHKGRLH